MSYLHSSLICAVIARPGLEPGAGVGLDAGVVLVTLHLAPGLGPPPVAGEHHDAGGEDAEGEGRGEGHDQEEAALRGVRAGGELPVVRQGHLQLHVLLPAVSLAPQLLDLSPPPQAVALHLVEALGPAVRLLHAGHHLGRDHDAVPALHVLEHEHPEVEVVDESVDVLSPGAGGGQSAVGRVPTPVRVDQLDGALRRGERLAVTNPGQVSERSGRGQVRSYLCMMTSVSLEKFHPSPDLTILLSWTFSPSSI